MRKKIVLISSLILSVPLYCETLVFTWINPLDSIASRSVITYIAELTELLNDVEIVLVYQPNKRAVVSLESGLTDGDFARSIYIYSESENVVQIPYPILETTYIMCTNDPGIVIDDSQTWLGKTIAVPRGEAISKKFIEEYGINSVIVANDMISSLKLLDSGRAHYTIMPIQIASEMEQALSENSMIIFHRDPLFSVPVFIYLHKRHKNLVPDFNEAVKKLHDSGRTLQIFGS